MILKKALAIYSFACLVALPLMAQEEEIKPTSGDNSSRQLSLGYRLKRSFWESFHTTLVSTSLKLDNNTLAGPVGRGSDLIPWNQLDSRIPIGNVSTAYAPSSDSPFLRNLASSALYYLRTFYPLPAGNLPSIPQNVAQTTLLFPQKYQRYIDFSPLPEEFNQGMTTGDMVAALALKGPLAHYIECLDPQQHRYKIDLSSYEKWPVRQGLSELGGVAFLTYNPELQRMETQKISYLGQDYTKDLAEEWQQKQKILLMTMSADTAIVRHLLYTHMLVAGVFSAVNNRYLHDKHPLRILMHPHQHLTLGVNNSNVKLLLGNESSFFTRIFSYNRETLLKLVQDKIDNFKFSLMDITEDLKARCMDSAQSDSEPVPYPYAENTTRLRSIIQHHVQGYLDLYYQGDQALREDASVGEWYKALNQHIPNGITAYAPEISKENISKLVTTFIYTASVEHENVGNIKAHYGIWHPYIPTQVPLDPKKLPTIDVLQQYVDLTFLTSIPSWKVTDDFSFLGIDEAGKNSLKQFSEAMQSYQAELDQKDFNYYTIYPKNLETAVSS